VNPTLTIVALAIRQADYLADELSKGNLWPGWCFQWVRRLSSIKSK